MDGGTLRLDQTAQSCDHDSDAAGKNYGEID